VSREQEIGRKRRVGRDNTRETMALMLRRRQRAKNQNDRIEQTGSAVVKGLSQTSGQVFFAAKHLGV
ncbi:MAG: hypothetical protein ACKO2L_04805, partial [Planctomycetaceae bacterium]